VILSITQLWSSPWFQSNIIKHLMIILFLIHSSYKHHHHHLLLLHHHHHLCTVTLCSILSSNTSNCSWRISLSLSTLWRAFICSWSCPSRSKPTYNVMMMMMMMMVTIMEIVIMMMMMMMMMIIIIMNIISSHLALPSTSVVSPLRTAGVRFHLWWW